MVGRFWALLSWLRAAVGQSVPLEPGRQVFDGIEVRGIWLQERYLDVPLQAVQVLAHEMAAMALKPSQITSKGRSIWALERMEEFDKCFLLDAALV